jgi:hypothetical protein
MLPSRVDNFCRLKGGLSTAQEKSNIKYMRNANASVRLRDEAKTAREKAKEEDKARDAYAAKEEAKRKERAKKTSEPRGTYGSP